MKSIRVAVAAAAVGIALTACSSPMQAGAAAVVGNERITTSKVNADSEAYKSALKQAKLTEEALGGVPVSHVVLQRLINVAVIKQLMARYKVQATETEVDAMLKDPGQYQSAQINLLAAGVAPSDARDYGRAMVGLSKLQKQFGNDQKLAQEFGSIKPVLNPRYGTFNPERSQENPGIFIDTGRFGKLTVQPQQPATQAQG
ncbi:SurA N-terminal domain-containing protein [Nonomuraea polychroma]|uniref:SurA N-terminal domain-containing protein n=1 Tax=Nonomuraea polychroma TaxID=46176 RepID=UPI000FDF6184|nr:SurA N-terminal domain-containing protein [Nonomuraea polychroma]